MPPHGCCDVALERAGSVLRLLAALALTGFYGFVLFTAVTTGPAGRPEFVVPVVGYGNVSFFQKESQKVDDARSYLADFPDTLREYGKDFMGSIRVNNNPPGTTMVFYAGRRVAAEAPGVAGLAVEAIFGSGVPANERFASSLVGEWLLLFGAALAFLPAWLVASRLSGSFSFFPAAVAMLAGSMLLFNPDNDTLQVTFFLWMLYFFLRAYACSPAHLLACSTLPRRSRAGRGAGVRVGGEAAPSVLSPRSSILLFGFLFGLAASAAFFFSLATAIVVIVCFTAAALSKDYRRPLVLSVT